jgi:hypothetical protein
MTTSTHLFKKRIFGMGEKCKNITKSETSLTQSEKTNRAQAHERQMTNLARKANMLVNIKRN